MAEEERGVYDIRIGLLNLLAETSTTKSTHND